MILYNTTIKVDHDIREDFLDWVLEVHFPEAMDSGLVREVARYHLLGVDAEDGNTYSLQYKLADLGTYHRFLVVIDSKFKKMLPERYGVKQVSFSSVLQMV
jgi:hypothetical protein